VLSGVLWDKEATELAAVERSCGRSKAGIGVLYNCICSNISCVQLRGTVKLWRRIECIVFDSATSNCSIASVPPLDCFRK
jgi:hypothetical protein